MKVVTKQCTKVSYNKLVIGSTFRLSGNGNIYMKILLISGEDVALCLRSGTCFRPCTDGMVVPIDGAFVEE